MSRNRTVLITNLVFRSYSGTETYVRDFSLGLLRQGYSPVVFSPQLGMISHELRRAGIPVVDDLEALGAVPDVIHGHHTLETMTAILRFPQTPAIFVCHDANAWHDAPPKFPQISKYIAVDQATHDRLVMSHSISPESVEIIGNYIDLARFRHRCQIGEKPRRALVFSNYMRPQHLQEIRQACHKRGIELDVLGKGHRNLSIHPETILPDFDLVFAKGRCALEAMACGAATIVCDVKGSGPLVTSMEFDNLRKNNFGRRLLTHPLDSDYIGQQIDRYGKRDVELVTARVRTECGVDRLAQQMHEVYEAAIFQFSQISSQETIVAAYQGTKWIMQNRKQFEPKPVTPKAKQSANATKRGLNPFSKLGRSIRKRWDSFVTSELFVDEKNVAVSDQHSDENPRKAA